MANEQNLTPVQPGQVLNPKGRGKGHVNRATILKYFLFEFDPENLLPDQRPKWWDKVKPKSIYEAATLAMGIQAMSGDTKAYNALNRALGLKIDAEMQFNVVHIYKPEKLSVDQLAAEGEALRHRAQLAVEAETDEPIQNGMASPTGTAAVRPANT